MKPHEEQLTVEDRYPSPVVTLNGETVAVFFGPRETALARAKLYAQSSKMAQLLSEIRTDILAGYYEANAARMDDVLRDAGVIP